MPRSHVFFSHRTLLYPKSLDLACTIFEIRAPEASCICKLAVTLWSRTKISHCVESQPYIINTTSNPRCFWCFSRNMTLVLSHISKLIKHGTKGETSPMFKSHGKKRFPCVSELNIVPWGPLNRRIGRFNHCLRHEGPMLTRTDRKTFLFPRPMPPTRIFITIVLACSRILVSVATSLVSWPGGPISSQIYGL